MQTHVSHECVQITSLVYEMSMSKLFSLNNRRQDSPDERAWLFGPTVKVLRRKGEDSDFCFQGHFLYDDIKHRWKPGVSFVLVSIVCDWSVRILILKVGF